MSNQKSSKEQSEKEGRVIRKGVIREQKKMKEGSESLR
jgi:hypothetical protein